MEEAVIEDIREYPSLLKLFTRQLKDSARTISAEYSLVSALKLHNA
jgi:phosphatidylserine decarboxylase